MQNIIGNTNYRELKDKRYIDSTADNIRMLAERLTAEKIAFSGRINDYKATITVDGNAALERAKAILDEIIRENPERQRTFIGNTKYRYIADKRMISCTAAEANALNEFFGKEKKPFSGVIDSVTSARVTVSGDADLLTARRFLDDMRYSDLISEMKDKGFEIMQDNSADSSYITIRNARGTGEVFGFESYDEVRKAFEDTSNGFFHSQAFKINMTVDRHYYIFAYDSLTNVYNGVMRNDNGAVSFDNVQDAIDFANANNIALTNSAEEYLRFEKFDRETAKAGNIAAAEQIISANAINANETHYEFSENKVTISYYNPDGNDGNGQFVEVSAYEADVMNAYTERINGGDFLESIDSRCSTVLIDSDTDDFVYYAGKFVSDRNNENVMSINWLRDDTDVINSVISAVEDNFETVRSAKAEESEKQEKYGRIADMLIEVSNKHEDDPKLADYAMKLNYNKNESTNEYFPAFDDYFPYDQSRSEKENIMASFALEKTAWIDMYIHDYPVAAEVREVSRLLHSFSEEFDYGEVLTDLVGKINEKKQEIIELAQNEDYKSLSAAVSEINTMQEKADRLRERIQDGELSVRDVNVLRSTEPARMSVQNMRDSQVAQVTRFERQQQEKMGAKSAFEMRRSDNAWRNDTSLTVPVINIPKRELPEKIAELRKKEHIDRMDRGTFHNDDIGIDIMVSRRSVEEIISKAVEIMRRDKETEQRDKSVDLRLSALYNLDAIIKNAVCFDSHISEYDSVHSKNKSANTMFIHRMYLPVNFEGEMYLLNLAVEEYYKTNKEKVIDGYTDTLYSLKDAKITPIEANRIFSPAVSSQIADEDTSTSVIKISIAQLYDLVKTYDQNFYENPRAAGRAGREEEIKLNRDYEQAVNDFKENAAEVSVHKKVLDLENRSITFTVVDLDNTERFILEGVLDSSYITGSDEFKEYAGSTEFEDVQLHYTSYIYGDGPDNEESTVPYLTDDEKSYLSANLNAVTKEALLLDERSLTVPAVTDREYPDPAEYTDQESTSALDRAKQLISGYYEKELRGYADFSEPGRIDLAYTEHEDTDKPIQVYADLETYRIVTLYNNEIVNVDRYDSLDDMNKVLENLDFNELVSADDAIAEYYANKMSSLGDVDRIEINRDNETVYMSYYNPDSSAGGQIVYNTFDFDTLKEAAESPEPYNYILENSRETAADIGDYDFIAAAEEFLDTGSENVRVYSFGDDSVRRLAEEVNGGEPAQSNESKREAGEAIKNERDTDEVQINNIYKEEFLRLLNHDLGDEYPQGRLGLNAEERIEFGDKSDIIKYFSENDLTDEQYRLFLVREGLPNSGTGFQLNALDMLYAAQFSASEYDTETAVREMFGSEEERKPIWDNICKLDTLSKCARDIERTYELNKNVSGFSADMDKIEDTWNGGFYSADDVMTVAGISAGGERKDEVLSGMNADLAALAGNKTKIEVSRSHRRAFLNDADKFREAQQQKKENEKFFNSDLFLLEYAKSNFAWDEIEDIGYLFFDEDHIDKRKPRDDIRIGKSLTEPELYDLIRKQRAGEDISEQLVKGLNDSSVFLYDPYDKPLKLDVSVEFTDSGITFNYEDNMREVSYKELADSYLKLFENEYNYNRDGAMAEEIYDELKENYGIDIDFRRTVAVVSLETTISVYEGGIDENGHERKDNYSSELIDVRYGHRTSDSDLSDYFIGYEKQGADGFTHQITEYEMMSEIRDYIIDSLDDPEKRIALTDNSGNKTYPEIKRPEPEMSITDKAINAINDFSVSEYSMEADFSDMKNIGLVNTDVAGNKLELWITADLESYSLSFYLDDSLLKRYDYGSLQDMYDSVLSEMSYDSLMDEYVEIVEGISDEELINKYSLDERTVVDAETAVSMWDNEFDVYVDGEKLPDHSSNIDDIDWEWSNVEKINAGKTLTVLTSDLEKQNYIDFICDKIDKICEHSDDYEGIAEYADDEDKYFKWNSGQNVYINVQKALVENNTAFIEEYLNSEVDIDNEDLQPVLDALAKYKALITPHENIQNSVLSEEELPKDMNVKYDPVGAVFSELKRENNFNDRQTQFLDRLENQISVNGFTNAALALRTPLFEHSYGGLRSINRMFDGKLNDILGKINTALDLVHKNSETVSPAENNSPAGNGAKDARAVGRQALFSVSAYDEKRFYKTDKSIDEILSAANSETPFAELANLDGSERISEAEFAGIQQSAEFTYSVEVDLDENTADICKVNDGSGGVPENARTEENCSYETIDIKEYFREEEKAVYQLLTYSGDEVDEKKNYSDIDEAVKAGKNYLSEGYAGYCVYNTENKMIREWSGGFPFDMAFNADILRLNGMDNYVKIQEERAKIREEMFADNDAPSGNEKTYAGITREMYHPETADIKFLSVGKKEIPTARIAVDYSDELYDRLVDEGINKHPYPEKAEKIVLDVSGDTWKKIALQDKYGNIYNNLNIDDVLSPEEYEIALSVIDEAFEMYANRETVKHEEKTTVEVGDRFRDKFSKDEIEVVSLEGAVPWQTDQCTVSRESGSFVITENKDISALIDTRRYEFLGNSEKELNAADDVLADYEPEINDIVEMDERYFRIADVSEKTVKLIETDTFFSEITEVNIDDFRSSGFKLAERAATVNSAENDNKDFTDDITALYDNVTADGGVLEAVIDENSDMPADELKEFTENFVDNAVLDGHSDNEEFVRHFFEGDNHSRIVSDIFDKAYSAAVEKKSEKAAQRERDEQLSGDKSDAYDYTITDEHLGEATPKARYANNIAAVKMLKAIESENRTAMPEEQEILAKYTGWGAIPQAFDENNISWKKEYAELQEILTPDEYSAARSSVLNAYFTSPLVIKAVYEGLEKLGFEGGRILEPSAGIGNFFGAMPANIRGGSRLTGVEIDDLTGRIARQLYQKADIFIKGFEKTTFGDNTFDAVVGNVPFGDYRVNDSRYIDRKFMIHDYFIAKALDKVHPGGIVAVVTSKGTLDKENDSVRKYLAQRAELIGAVRLPGGKNGVFRANAGTDVTPDILFLQKRERPIEIDPDKVPWLKKTENADGFRINNYFVEHPEMVLGRIVEGNKLYGNQEDASSCEAIEGADIRELLHNAMQSLNGQYKAAEKSVSEETEDVIPAPADSRKYSYYTVGGDLYYRAAGETMKKVEPSGKKITKDMIARAAAMVELRDNVHELLDMQYNNTDGSLDSKISESRERLNRIYDRFTEKYGAVSDKKNAKAFSGDDGYRLISALEVKDANGNITGKADIFTKNTMMPRFEAPHVESAEEALILSVAEKGKVDFEFMTEVSGIEKNELISELTEKGQIYRLPQDEEKYVTADEYLTGNIRKKLRELDNAPADMDVSGHREALTNALPPRVEAKDISVRLGASWIPPHYIKAFIEEHFNPPFWDKAGISVEYSRVAGTWNISAPRNCRSNYESTHTFGTERMNAYNILQSVLNNGSLQVKDRVKDEYGAEIRDMNGNYVLTVNEGESDKADKKAKAMKRAFEDWMFKDPDRRNDLVNIYNETFNSVRQREYDGSHLNFSGMNPDITLKEHQKNAVARALYGGNTLLAHAVGAGKSFEMIAIAMEGKRLGLHHKSLFAVPNALTEQMGSDFRRLYPNARILVAAEKDFKKENRQELLGRIANNDWDAIIIGHSHA